MGEPKVTLSPDRMEATIHADNGVVYRLRSRREEGFNEDNLNAMLTFQYGPAPTMEPGQRKVARLKRVFGVPYVVTVMSGPPTWWLPKVDVSVHHKGVMVGWLRRAVSVQLSSRNKEQR